MMMMSGDLMLHDPTGIGSDWPNLQEKSNPSSAQLNYFQLSRRSSDAKHVWIRMLTSFTSKPSAGFKSSPTAWATLFIYYTFLWSKSTKEFIIFSLSVQRWWDVRLSRVWKRVCETLRWNEAVRKVSEIQGWWKIPELSTSTHCVWVRAGDASGRAVSVHEL